MQIFRDMSQPDNGDIRQYSGYAQLSESDRKNVDNKYSEVFNGSQRLGLAIAHGMAYQAAKQMCEDILHESKGAFKRLQAKLERQGHSEESAGAIAASIGNAKYGKKAMQKGARTGHPVSEDEMVEGFGDAIKKVASAVNDTINPRRRKAIKVEKIRKRVMGESEEGVNPEDDDGAAGIQKHNKELKYCDACDGVHAKDEKCAGCSNPENKPEDPKDNSTVPGGAGEILKKNHVDKGMKEEEFEDEPGPTYEDEESEDAGGSYCGEELISAAANYISSQVQRGGGILNIHESLGSNHSVLVKHGWKGGKLGVYSHPNHPGHTIQLHPNGSFLHHNANDETTKGTSLNGYLNKFHNQSGLKEAKTHVLSRDPYARHDNIKQSVGTGSCDWCGNEGKLYQYGTENDNGKRGFSKGKFCSKGCHKAYHS